MDWLLEEDVSEKRVVSIFRPEGKSEVETARCPETLTSTDQSTCRGAITQKSIITILICHRLFKIF
jgi:hypothetical protein